MNKNWLLEDVISRRKIQTKKFGVKNVAKVVSKIIKNVNVLVGVLNKRGKLHGIDHLVNKKYHPLERFLWFLLVIAAFYCVFEIGNHQMERYSANPTVISLERGTLIAS